MSAQMAQDHCGESMRYWANHRCEQHPDPAACADNIVFHSVTDRTYGIRINAPTVWFASMASLAAVLPEDNRALLRVIREAKPRSLTELAELTGRKLPNLSRTIKTMAS